MTRQNLVSTAPEIRRLATLNAKRLILGSLFCGAALAPQLCQAQQTATTTGEIVVTAQRRSEKLQDVPITISAFNASALVNAGVTSLPDLNLLVPGLVYTNVIAYGLPYLRGVGTTATGPGFESPVATYVDGVYFASQAGALIALNNVAGVEVDKGPQGTLFGRNATGGAIQITTLDPSMTPGGKVEVGYGDYNTVEGQLYATSGLTSNLAGNLALAYSNQGIGYARNLANGDYVDQSRDFSVRTKLLFTPNNTTTINLALDYEHADGVPAENTYPGSIPQFGPPLPSNPRDDYGDPQPYSHNTQWGITLNVKKDLGFATLTSITAYRNTIFIANFDGTLTAVPGTTFFLQGPEPHNQATEELQLASTKNDKFEWITGAYFYFERAGDLEPTILGGSSFDYFGLPGGLTQAPDDYTYSLAGYAQGTYHLTSKTSLTAGFRLTDEYKDDKFVQVIPAFADVESFHNYKNFVDPTWRFAIQHYYDRNIMSYISYSRGFKSGGFNVGTPYKPETLDAIETGVKSTFMGGRLQVNSSLFYYYYQNVQLVTYPNGSLIIGNAPAAADYGVDLDGTFTITPNLKFTGSLEGLNTRFTSFPESIAVCSYTLGATAQPSYGTAYEPCDDTGKKLPKAPALTTSVGLDYSKQLSFAKVGGDVTYSYDSGWFAESDNRLRQRAYSVVNASVRIGASDDNIVLRLWGKNLANSLYASFIASETDGDQLQWAPPRTFGATLSKTF
jgi:iron complex outermembrane receptor protein